LAELDKLEKDFAVLAAKLAELENQHQEAAA
jgi:hypothetical protein